VLEGYAALGERYPWRVGADVAPLMRAALEREDPNLRASAARAVGRLRDPQAVPALIAALEDADRHGRRRGAVVAAPDLRPDAALHQAQWRRGSRRMRAW
jgi:HEAT repeat protein